MGKLNLVTVYEICHWDKDGNLLWKKENLLNTVHGGGEQFILKAAFCPSSITIPTNFYLGLDSRTTLSQADTLNSLVNEPTSNGYIRQPVSSTTGFSISTTGSIRATSAVVRFSASGGAWGPVKNLFLATSVGNSGLLITTTALGDNRTMNDGEGITLRMGVSLRNS